MNQYNEISTLQYYTGFFRTAGYIEQKTASMCDSDQDSISERVFTFIGGI